jgi:hypothetical protein
MFPPPLAVDGEPLPGRLDSKRKTKTVATIAVTATQRTFFSSLIHGIIKRDL